MLSSIKEFIVNTIFSGKKRGRTESSSKNILEYAPHKMMERKYYTLTSSGVKSIKKKNIIDITDDIQNKTDRSIKQIKIDDILKIKIQISKTELEFYEKLNSFAKDKYDPINYPPIESSKFLKLIR